MQELPAQPIKTISISPPSDHPLPERPQLPASPPSRYTCSRTQSITRSTASPALSSLSRAASVPSQNSLDFGNVAMPADLPKEVMLRILDKAVEGRGIRTRYDILLSASLVAKNWTSVAQELLCRHVVLKVQAKAKKWLKSPATSRYPIKSLEIDGRYDQITHKVTEDIVFRAHGLEKLRIDFVQRLSAKIFVFQSLSGSYFPLALIQALFTTSRSTLRNLVLSLQSGYSTPLRDQILCGLSSLDALETLTDWTRPHSDISLLLSNLPQSLKALETAFDDVSQISTLARSIHHAPLPSLERIRFIYLGIEDLSRNSEGRRMITELSERRIKIEHGFERKDLREEIAQVVQVQINHPRPDWPDFRRRRPAEHAWTYRALIPSEPRANSRPPQQTSRKHHQPSRTGLEELLSKLEQNPELVGELLREVKAREETCSEFANQKKSRSKRLKKQWDARSIHRQRPRKSSIDILQARPLRSTTERNEEISGEESEGSIEGEAAFLLSGVKGFDEDIEMGAGDPRGRTKVTTGAGPISSMKNLVQNAASFVRGRSPVRRPRISISSSPPLSRASSTSSHRSRSRSQSPAPAPLQYHDPVLGPFHPPKIKVDFKFPSSFNSTGLPNYPKNKFLPRRLREQSFVSLSILSTGGLLAIYLLWAVGLWYGYSAADKLKAFVEVRSSAFDELRSMATFALMSAWYFSTMALISFASFITSIFPQPELAKHLSRTIWVFGWMATWFVGIYGITAHLSSDAWTVAGCDRDETCETFRQKLQIWLFVALFVSLALVFWFAIVFSAFVHTLHPDIFHTGDVDSELDEYDHTCLLEEELRHSDHPLAGEALEWLKAEREASGGYQPSNREGLRSRRAYHTQSGNSESDSEGSDEEKDREALIGKERSSNSTISRGRPSSRPTLQAISASSSRGPEVGAIPGRDHHVVESESMALGGDEEGVGR
ncbi:hypothetical protein JCM5350_004115 [Sporobolomyces pararoseus]